MNSPRDGSVPHEVPEQSRHQLVLPANRKLIRIKSIPALVGRAMLAYLERSHAGDELAFKEAAFLLGFNNRSTHLDSIRLAVLAHRDSGEIVVREANGFGVIRDDDVMRGWLMREDFARLLGAEWRIDLPAPQGDADAPAAVAAELAPGVVAAAKKWTDERLAGLRDYRQTHGTKKAAEHFRVSGSRVRKLLPMDKPATKGYSVFTHRQK